MRYSTLLLVLAVMATVIVNATATFSGIPTSRKVCTKMKSAEVVLVLVVVMSVFEALTDGEELVNGGDNSVSEAALNDTVTDDPLEDRTTKIAPEEEATVTNVPTNDPSNEKEATVQSVTTQSPSTAQNGTANQNESGPSVNASSPSEGKKWLSTEVNKSDCQSLGIPPPNARGCKCYKQRSAGTDLPHGFCYYYKCAGNILSSQKCKFEAE